MTRAAANSVSLQDYLAGRLSEVDRRAFEDRLVNDASMVRDIEESLRIREGLEILRDQRRLVVPGSSRRRAASQRWVRASAAAAAIALLGVSIFYLRHSPAVVAASVAGLPSHASVPLPVVERYSFATLREARQVQALTLPSSGAIELRTLTSDAGTGRTFRVSLDSIGGPKSVRIGGAEHLARDADGFVIVYVDASKLPPGEYALIVEPDIADDSAGERFIFDLKRATGPTTDRD